MEALRVDDAHQHQRHHQPQRQAGKRPDQAQPGAFQPQHLQDLAARHAHMAQHAELAHPRQHLRRKTRRHPDQADDDGNGFQRIGNGETAIENGQRHGPHLRRAAELRLALHGHRQRRLQGLLHRARVGAGIQIKGGFRRGGIASEAAIVLKRHDNCPPLPGIIAPGAGHEQPARHPADHQFMHLALPPTIKPGQRLRNQRAGGAGRRWRIRFGNQGHR